jgi:hypothetical protein
MNKLLENNGLLIGLVLVGFYAIYTISKGVKNIGTGIGEGLGLIDSEKKINQNARAVTLAKFIKDAENEVRKI